MLYLLSALEHKIKRTLSQPKAIEHILNLLDATDDIERTELADQVCEKFGFFDPRGDVISDAPDA